MSTPQKEATVAELTQQFREAKSLLFADYRGLDVEAISELRRRCREAGVQFRVSKNTLMRLAIAEIGMPDLGEILEGPTGTAIAHEDELAPARVLVEFSRENDNLQVKGGIMDGRVYSVEEVMALALLPPRDQLIGQLLAMIESPLVYVIGVAESLMRDVLSCAEQAAEGEGSAPAAPAETEAVAEAPVAEGEAPVAEGEAPVAEGEAPANAAEAPMAEDGGEKPASASSDEPAES